MSPQVQALLLMRVLNLRLVPALTPGKLQTLVPLLVPVLTTLMRGSPATVLRQVLVLLLVILLLEPALATVRLRMLVVAAVPVPATQGEQESALLLMPDLAA